jgi:hypothetical protein
LWNDDLDLAQIVSSKSLSYLPQLSAMNNNINDRLSHRYSVEQLNQPRDNLSILHTAIRYSIENPFVAKAGRVKTDFTLTGIQHKTHKTHVKEFFDYQWQRLSMSDVLRTIVYHLYTVGIVPVWWSGEDGSPIQNIMVMDPRQCQIEWNFQKPTVYVKVDTTMIAAVGDPEGKIDIRNRAKFAAMPKYWVEQIKSQLANNKRNDMLIELQAGSYTVITNRYGIWNRTISTLDGLPLQPAFSALQRYQLLTAGDFALSWNIKNMIMMISEGDPKAEGKLWTPVTTERLSKLQAQFQRPDTSFTVYVDPTTKVEWVFPPVEIYNKEKYHQPLKEIKEVLNLPSFMWNQDGENTNFANAVSEVKVLRLEVNTIRQILETQFFRPFYSRLQRNSRISAKDIVYPTFSMTSLMDDALVLKSVQEVYGIGACSVRTVMEVFGLDPDYEIEQMQMEHDKYGSSTQDDMSIFSPLYNPGHPEDPNGDQGGRPAGLNSAPKPTARSPRTAGK